MSNIDITVVVLYFLVIAAISWWQGQKVKTIEDFSLGKRSYGTFFLFSTLSATFIGGGFTTGLAQKVFQFGPIYIMVLWGSCLRQMLTALLVVPRMAKFKSLRTVAEIMGTIYGKRARTFTGIASIFLCAGVVGAQFVAFGYFFEIATGMPALYGVVAGAILVTTYTSFGGIRAIIVNDVVNLLILFIALPLVLFFAIREIGGVGYFIKIASNHHAVMPLSPMALFGLSVSFFLVETMSPPYVQRLLIGKTEKNTLYSTLFSGVASIPFFLIVGCIGLVACYMSPEISSKLALPYVIEEIMPVGLKGLAMAGMAAAITSTADSFLNAAGTSMSLDVMMRGNFSTKKQQLSSARKNTVFIGFVALIFAIWMSDVIGIVLLSYKFWAPFILVPLISGIYNYRISEHGFWVSTWVGVGVTLVTKIVGLDETIHIDSGIFGIAANLITFTTFFIQERQILFILPKSKKIVA